MLLAMHCIVLMMQRHIVVVFANLKFSSAIACTARARAHTASAKVTQNRYYVKWCCYLFGRDISRNKINLLMLHTNEIRGDTYSVRFASIVKRMRQYFVLFLKGSQSSQQSTCCVHSKKKEERNVFSMHAQQQMFTIWIWYLFRTTRSRRCRLHFIHRPAADDISCT